MLKKIIVSLSIVLSLGLIWVALTYDKAEQKSTQYIRILARGGYSPNQVQAKANMPTVLEVETKGTYDCSSSLNIPQMGYQKSLPPTGITKIEVPEKFTASTLDILCSMGMYRSAVNFAS